MKILFGIQGTGNGHISRCIPIIQEIERLGHQVDVLISGISHELSFPFTVKYKKQGLSYIFGKKGGIDLVRTLLRCNLYKLLKEIINCPVKQYDYIITDFEPITAWASKLRKVKCVGFGNQYAAKHYPIQTRTFQEKLGTLFLQYFAPVKAAVKYDYLQNPFQNTYFPEINNLKKVSEIRNKVLVYLPAHSQESLIYIAKNFAEHQFISFSKWAESEGKPLQNLTIFPISQDKFIQTLASSSFVITAAGFGLTSELIQLQKNMLIIPMKGQIEQKINADKLKKLGYCICYSHKDIDTIEQWLKNPRSIKSLAFTSTADITKALISLN